MSLRRVRFWLTLLTLFSLLAFAGACSSADDEEDIVEDEEAAGAETAGGATTPYNPTGNEGTLAGTVAFNGTPPETKRVSMDADPQCNNPNPVAEDVIVKDGKLVNVFVYVKDGQVGGKKIATYKFAVPAEERVLDQHGCHYAPHVIGIQAGQKLKVTNSDPTAHNVNVQPQANQKWNQSQPPGASPIEKNFARAEATIPVKCNQHPWMKAWINVMNHPFYGVSGNDGKFEIRNLPPGTYTVEAWHEKYGTQSQQVTIGDKESKTLDFSFTGSATASHQANTPFELLPALELPMLAHH